MLIATGATVGLGYLFQIAAAHWLTTLEYGELSVILATLNVMTVPVFGMCMVVTRDVAAASEWTASGLVAIIRPHAARVASVTITLLAGLWVFNSWLRGFLQLSTLAPIVYLAILVLLTNAVGVGRAVLLGLHDFASVAFNQVAEALVRLASTVAFALLGFATTGFSGYSLGLALALGLVYGRFRFRLRRRTAQAGDNQMESAHLPPVVRGRPENIGWAAIIVTGSFIVLLNMDLIVVKHFVAPDVAGQYAAISMLAKALFVITNAFDVVLFPMASAARAGGGDDTAHLRGALFSIGLIVVPILVVYRLSSTFLVTLLFGARYADASSLLFPYALAVTLLGLATLLARYRLAVGARVPSSALLATVAATASAFAGFHETLAQIVSILLLSACASLCLTLVGYHWQLTVDSSGRGV